LTLLIASFIEVLQMNTKTVRGKNISIGEAHTTKPSFRESRQAAKRKFAAIPFRLKKLFLLLCLTD
jgi:hypothetical protein